MYNILIATPAYQDQVTVTYLNTIVSILKECAKPEYAVNVQVITISSADIALARNYLAARFMQEDYTHILFVDADIGFNFTLLLKMLNYDKPFVASFCPQRYIDAELYHKISRIVDYSSLTERISTKLVCENQIIAKDSISSFASVESIGTGVMLLKREVFEKLRDQYPELWSNEKSIYKGFNIQGKVHQCFSSFQSKETNNFLGEDVAFCKRWRLIGETIWACTDEVVQHVGQKVYSGRYSERQELLNTLSITE